MNANELEIVVITSLESMYSKRGWMTPEHLVTDLEEWLALKACDVIYTAVQQPTVSGTVFRELDIFILNDLQYTVDRESRLPTLVIRAACIAEHDVPMVSREVMLPEAVGSYQFIRVEIPEGLSEQADNIISNIEVVYTSGYRWVREGLIGMLHSPTHFVSDPLYGLLRQSFTEDIVSNLWLYLIPGSDGLYIPDRRQLVNILSKASSPKLRTWRSPIQITADFATITMRYERTLSQAVCSSNKTIDASFASVPYAQTGVHLKEQVIYGAPNLVLQPIVNTGNTHMTVGYPAFIKSDALEAKLEALRPMFKARLAANLSGLRQLTNNLPGLLLRLDSGGKWSYKIGQMIRGIIDGVN